MPYSDFTRDYNANDGFNKNQKEIDMQWEQHKKSPECLGENCPICKEFKERYYAESSTLP